MLLQSLGAEDLGPDDFAELEGGFTVDTQEMAEDGPHQLVACVTDRPLVRNTMSQSALVTP